jgi:hypothetical protein
MAKSLFPAIALAVLMANNVLAQFSITPGGLNNGIGTFQNGALPTSIIGAGSSGANFRPGGLTSTPDHSFASWWWFRGPGDTREFTFGNGSSGSLTVSGVTVGTNDGSSSIGGYDFTVTNAAYSFLSNQRWEIFNPSNTAGTNVQVVATNTITNTGNSTETFSMFFYQDFDIGGTAGGDSAVLLNPNYMRITDGTTGDFVDWLGIGANAYQVTAFATLRGSLADAGITNLNNTGLPFGPGDFTGGFQWDITLGAGQSIVLASAFTLNGEAIPEPTSFAALAMGALGLFARRRRIV